MHLEKSPLVQLMILFMACMTLSCRFFKKPTGSVHGIDISHYKIITDEPENEKVSYGV